MAVAGLVGVTTADALWLFAEPMRRNVALREVA